MLTLQEKEQYEWKWRDMIHGGIPFRCLKYSSFPFI
jgi:hypothetical protein